MCLLNTSDLKIWCIKVTDAEHATKNGQFVWILVAHFMVSNLTPYTMLGPKMLWSCFNVLIFASQSGCNMTFCLVEFGEWLCPCIIVSLSFSRWFSLNSLTQRVSPVILEVNGRVNRPQANRIAQLTTYHFCSTWGKLLLGEIPFFLSNSENGFLSYTPLPLILTRVSCCLRYFFWYLPGKWGTYDSLTRLICNTVICCWNLGGKNANI